MSIYSLFLLFFQHVGYKSDRQLTISAITAEDDVVDPVSVVLHRLHEGVPPVVAVPYPDDGVSACSVQPVHGRVELQGIDGRPVAHLHLISNDK